MKLKNKAFLIFSIMIFIFMVIYMVTEKNNINRLKEDVAKEEAKSILAFLTAFRQTYQNTFVHYGIKINEKTVNLLPVRTTNEIASKFSKLIDNKTHIRVVSDRPRNPINQADSKELAIIDFFKKNPKKSEYSSHENYQKFYYAQPLYIKKSCLKCHGKREDTLPTIRDNYDTAYDYEVGDLRGIMSIELASNTIDRIESSHQRNVVSTAVLYLVLTILSFILVRSMGRTQQDMEEKTKEQEQLLKLLNTGDSHIFRWKNDEQWSIEYTSKNIKKLFGHTCEDFLSNKIDYESVILKRDRDFVAKEVQNAVEKNLDFFTHKPYRIRTKDGQVKWVLDNTLLVRNDKKEVTHFFGYITDITDIQEAKERFQLASESSNGGLWDWNLRTKKIDFTPKWKNQLGYKDDEISNELSELTNRIHPEDKEEAIRSIENYFEHHVDNYVTEHRLQHKNGSWIWMLVQGKASFDKKGRILRMVGFHIDISLQKEYENNLEVLVLEKTNENIKQLEALQQQGKMAQMGEMIGSIAHQWRQPLNELGINIQNLKYDYKSQEIDESFIKSFIVKNKQTIEFMSKTIDDFRNFFRVDKEKESFSTQEAIENIISMQSAQLKTFEIFLTIEGDDFKIYGFRNEFQQVILNLINNAKDALIENKIEDPMISIILKNKTIAIKDNAGGVDEESIDRIFEPYFSTKEQGKGTGMGLYMSNMIIEDNMGGKLEITNEDDGAVFTIRGLNEK